MKKFLSIVPLFVFSLLLVSCSSPGQSSAKEEASFVEFDFGVNSKNQIKGDTNNFANISGTVADGDFVYLVDYESGTVFGLAPVKDGYFELSTNMVGLDNQKLIFTNEEVDFPLVEDVSTIKQKVDLVFIANSSSKNEASEEEIEPIEESEEEVVSNAYDIGTPISFSSAEGDKIDITVTNVTKYEGDDYHVAEGVHFARVEFTLKNNGTSPFDISSHDFEFYDSQGFKSELISKDFFSESVQPGKSVQGVGYFDVINDGDSFEIYFADSSWTGTYK